MLALYAKGMSQRDITDTIEDIYGFNISHETISEITDKVLDELSEWQKRYPWPMAKRDRKQTYLVADF